MTNPILRAAAVSSPIRSGSLALADLSAGEVKDFPCVSGVLQIPRLSLGQWASTVLLKGPRVDSFYLFCTGLFGFLQSESSHLSSLLKNGQPCSLH